MAQPLLDFATPGLEPGDAWHSLDEWAGRVPAGRELRPGRHREFVPVVQLDVLERLASHVLDRRQ